MFNYIINPPDQQPVQMELPNQWLWDIIDEFIYQFQNYSQYRSKLQQKDAAEIALINDAIEENVWSVHSVLNVLQTLVERSKINEQLKAYNEKKSMDEVRVHWFDFYSLSLGLSNRWCIRTASALQDVRLLLSYW